MQEEPSPPLPLPSKKPKRVRSTKLELKIHGKTVSFSDLVKMIRVDGVLEGLPHVNVPVNKEHSRLRNLITAELVRRLLEDQIIIYTSSCEKASITAIKEITQCLTMLSKLTSSLYEDKELVDKNQPGVTVNLNVPTGTSLGTPSTKPEYVDLASVSITGLQEKEESEEEKEELEEDADKEP